MPISNFLFTPPSGVSIAETGLIQNFLDKMGPVDGSGPGGTITLPRGDFYGDLVVRYQDTQILGQGWGTRIHGQLLCLAGYCTFSNFWLNPRVGSQYGMRLSNTFNAVGVSGVPRCVLDRLRIGGTTQDGTDGPVNGLEMDGAIVTTATRSLFTSCSGSGVYVDTTDNVNGFSTNVNLFTQCTLNLNGRYGVETIAGTPVGIGGLSFLGGNMESNGLGSVNCQAMNMLELKRVDFEQDANVHFWDDFVHASGVNTVAIEGCMFNAFNVVGGKPIKRAWNLNSCTGGTVVRNRGTGLYWNVDNGEPWGVIDETCIDIEEHSNWNPDVNGIAHPHTENRSRRY